MNRVQIEWAGRLGGDLLGPLRAPLRGGQRNAERAGELRRSRPERVFALELDVPERRSSLHLLPRDGELAEGQGQAHPDAEVAVDLVSEREERRLAHVARRRRVRG